MQRWLSQSQQQESWHATNRVPNTHKQEWSSELAKENENFQIQEDRWWITTSKEAPQSIDLEESLGSISCLDFNVL